MRHESKVINNDFKNALTDTLNAELQGATDSSLSCNRLEKNIKSFAQSKLAKLDHELYRFYRDNNYSGLSHDTLNRILNQGRPGNQELFDLLSYFAFGKDYITCLQEGDVTGNSVAFQFAKRKREPVIQSYKINDQNGKQMSLNAPLKEILQNKKRLKIQGRLNSIFQKGLQENISTAYHLERAQCSVYATDSSLLHVQKDSFSIKDNIAWEILFNKVTGRGDAIPAGGWYLIYEQRKFLQEQFEKIIKNHTGNEIRICEAGCASFVHHFTFVSILIDALRASGKDLKVKLYIIDEYLFPLYQVAEVLDKIIIPKNLFPMEFMPVEGDEGRHIPGFSVKPGFIDFINTSFGIKYYDKYITSTDYLLNNLCVTKDIPNLNFDIITEHFLMKQDSDANTLEDWLNKIADSYRQFAPKGRSMHLISAIGEKANDEHGHYFDLYKKKGFKIERQEMVWDIHDQNYYYGNQVDKSVQYTPKNHLIHWKYLETT